MAALWTAFSGTSLGTLNERSTTTIPLPISSSYDNLTLTKISGELPPGIRIEGLNLVGTPFEVQRTKVFTFVIRASLNEDSSGSFYFEDRTFRITIEGPDNPVWLTPEDLLAIGPNDTFFVLDTAPVDFQLEVIDTDIAAGDQLEFFIKPGNGVLPPGLQLTSDGRIVGVTEPLISLDRGSGSGHYDTNGYSGYPFDFGILPANGFSSFYYDSTFYDLSIPTRSPRKLNRFYQFIVSVTDGETIVDRKFRIYLVGDDFLRSDNTIMTSADGIFKADNTYVRTPIWLTPGDLGFRRANNYITLFLDVLDTENLLGKIIFTLEDFNDDGSVSRLPPGLALDQNTGELAGRVPYQPAVTEEYKFTVRATRFTADVNVVFITGTFYEDTQVGKTSFKIFKLEQNSGGIFDAGADDLEDLKELVGRFIAIGEFSYKVISVESVNPDYDEIFLDAALNADIPLIVHEDAFLGSDNFFVETISANKRDELEGRKLIFSKEEVCTIENVVPYIEWSVLNRSGGPLELNYQILGVDQPSGSPSFSDEIVRAFASTLGPVYVTSISDSFVKFRAPLTSNTSVNIIQEAFVSADSTNNIKIEKITDQISRVKLTDTLPRGILKDDNVGLAILGRESFTKEISVNSTDDTTQPYKDKTFTVNVLGEVDSTIQWLTDANLGALQANFTSILNVQAVTSIPNAKLVYTKTAGRLPPGLELLYDGEIVGKVRQFPDPSESNGLISFDNGTFLLDGGDTTIDRSFTFTVDARDRFGYSAIQREFTISVIDPDDKLYSNLIMKPMLKETQREDYNGLIANSTIFPPESIYRPNDPAFGLQKEIKILAYAGLETKSIEEYVVKAAKFHKRKRYIAGEIKVAEAKEPGTTDVIYEVVYLELIDPAEPKTGKVNKRLTVVNNSDKITVDSIQYETKEDQFKTNVGLPAIQVGDTQILTDEYLFESRDGQDFKLLPGDVDVLTRDGEEVIVTNETDSEPFKYRPKGDTVKADSDAVRVSDGNDVGKLISNTTNMRDELRTVGATERRFLPLWMRTAQEGGIQELGYILAVPLCYCKAGSAQTIKNNILRDGFNFKQFDIEVDRYIIDSTQGSNQDQYIAFPNYRFNV